MIGKFKNAYNYSRTLIECIENEKSFSLKINTGEFVFNTDVGEISFNYNMEKKCYSYCSMALTCCLYDSKTKAYEFIDKAQRLSYCDRTSTQ